jgi:hypothetical protein
MCGECHNGRLVQRLDECNPGQARSRQEVTLNPGYAAMTSDPGAARQMQDDTCVRPWRRRAKEPQTEACLAKIEAPPREERGCFRRKLDSGRYSAKPSDIVPSLFRIRILHWALSPPVVFPSRESSRG